MWVTTAPDSKLQHHQGLKIYGSKKCHFSIALCLQPCLCSNPPLNSLASVFPRCGVLSAAAYMYGSDQEVEIVVPDMLSIQCVGLGCLMALHENCCRHDGLANVRLLCRRLFISNQSSFYLPLTTRYNCPLPFFKSVNFQVDFCY